jgi:hypothetical protein
MPGIEGDKSAQFARVAARVREEIVRGVWELGERLPGELDLAARYGVSRGTVGRALVLLRAEGIVVTVHGQGSRVAAVPAVTVVRVGPGDQAVARLPEDAEREALGMAPGVPLLVVTRAGGAAELYDAAVTIVTGRLRPSAGRGCSCSSRRSWRSCSRSSSAVSGAPFALPLTRRPGRRRAPRW